MNNYETLISDYLLGETPKQKYEYLTSLLNENANFKAKLFYADISLKSILDTSDEAKLGNIKFMIELIKNQITIEDYDKK